MKSMNLIKIAAGTTSKKKIQYLKAVLKKLKVGAEIIPVKVKSGVSEQPGTITETKQGSLDRAISALKQTPGADLGIGIEMGGDFNEEKKRETFCWATVADKKGNCFSAQSFSLLQPKYYSEILERGEILGNYRHDFKEMYKNKGYIYEYLGKMLEYRRLFIINAIEKALIYYYCDKEF